MIGTDKITREQKIESLKKIQAGDIVKPWDLLYTLDKTIFFWYEYEVDGKNRGYHECDSPLDYEGLKIPNEEWKAFTEKMGGFHIVCTKCYGDNPKGENCDFESFEGLNTQNRVFPYRTNADEKRIDEMAKPTESQNEATALPNNPKFNDQEEDKQIPVKENQVEIIEQKQKPRTFNLRGEEIPFEEMNWEDSFLQDRIDYMFRR